MTKFNKHNVLKVENKSIIGSLLSEISWDGSMVKRYRDGGKGLENVLTTEVLQILYFLPRMYFLGEIVKRLHVNNNKAVDKLYEEIEDSDFDLFPGNHYLMKEPESHQKGMSVQPDSLLITESIYTLIEIKRIKRSSFQKEQLAKEFYLATREAGNKTPLLVLITFRKPPVNVSGSGRVDPVEHIKETIIDIYEKADSNQLTLSEIIQLVDHHVAWITWEEIYNIIHQQCSVYKAKNDSDMKSIKRQCNALLNAIERHS